MKTTTKIAGAFAVAAGVAYGAAWMSVGIHSLTSGTVETTREYSDNGLRILSTDYRASWSGVSPENGSYAVLLDSEEHGVVACHGIRSWPENTFAGHFLEGEYPDTLYANSPIFEHVFKKSDISSDENILELGSCFKYETSLSQDTIDALASEDFDGSAFRYDMARASADIGINNTYYGFPILQFQSFSSIALATAREENKHVLDMGSYNFRGDVTRIWDVDIIEDTVRDRRFLGPLSIIFSDLETGDRHQFTPQICSNAGYSDRLEDIAYYHGRSGFTVEKEQQLLKKLGELSLTICP